MTADRRRQRIAGGLLLLGVAGLVVAVLGGLGRGEAFFHGYLCAFVYWAAVPLGSSALLMLRYTAGGRWALGVRRSAEPAVLTLPLLALAFLPILLGLHSLYPWARPAEVANLFALQYQRPYLNAPFFVGRAAVYFAIWIVGGWLLSRWSRAAWRGDQLAARRLRALGPGLMVLHFLTVSFAAIDWIGALAGGWYSTVFGLYIIVGQALTALALLIIVEALRPPPPGLAEERVVAIRHDLGNLLLTLIVLHAYLAFSQGYIIWIGNTPDTISWYEPRVRGGWGVLGLILIGFHFGLPFLALLFRRVKRRARSLVAVALVILAARLLDVAWMVLPATRGSEQVASILLAIAAGIGLGGLWSSVFVWISRREEAAGP